MADLIDRQALGVGRYSPDILPAAYCAGWNGLLNLINEAPAVDAVEVVHGRWEHTREGGYFQGRCSACGKIAIKVKLSVCDVRDDFTIRWPYCPNCRAKMERRGDNG